MPMVASGVAMTKSDNPARLACPAKARPVMMAMVGMVVMVEMVEMVEMVVGQQT